MITFVSLANFLTNDEINNFVLMLLYFIQKFFNAAIPIYYNGNITLSPL